MGFVLFTGKCRGAGFSILRPVPDRFSIAVTGGRDVRHILRIRIGLAVKFDGRRICGYAFFRTGGWRLDLRCNSHFRAFLMGFILFTGKCHGAGFSILRPAPDRFSIAVTGGRNISKHSCLCHCPISLKGSRIGGFAFFRTSRILGLFTCDCSCCRFCMARVVLTDSRCRADISIFAPCIGCVIPIMAIVNCYSA